MKPLDETNVTAVPGRAPWLAFPNDASTSAPGGVWTLDRERLIAVDENGPATVLVPSEAVLLLAVDLPVAGAAKRRSALPFAIEDRIAEPIDAVHLGLGVELTPKRYLVAVVRHEMMRRWIDRVEEAGLGHAALVPDALALPMPDAGRWSVELAEGRAVVRTGDGTGFAIPESGLRTAWEAAGRPACTAYGAALPADMISVAGALEAEPLARRLLTPALDLRQGAYVRRRGPITPWARRLGRLAAIGLAAHGAIAIADTIMLKTIAERRAEETRVLVARAAPGSNIGGDLASTAADLLPASSGGAAKFLPLMSRVSAALAPFGGLLAVRTVRYDGASVVIDLDALDPTLRGRVTQALSAARIEAPLAALPDGGVRLTARGGA